MMKRSRLILLAFIVGEVAITTMATPKDIPMVNMLSINELRNMLDNPDLTIIDVRYEKDWGESDVKIKGAVREDYMRVETWADKYPKDKLIVLYCA